MIGRLFYPTSLALPQHGHTALAYSAFDLALLLLVAQAIAYYARTGYWPKLAPHDAAGGRGVLS